MGFDHNPVYTGCYCQNSSKALHKCVMKIEIFVICRPNAVTSPSPTTCTPHKFQKMQLVQNYSSLLHLQVPLWIPTILILEQIFRFLTPLILSPDFKYMIGVALLVSGILIYCGIIYQKTEIKIMRKYYIYIFWISGIWGVDTTKLFFFLDFT